MILCNGEALIDMLPRDSQSGEACFAPYPGGAVFNTAIALGRLGCQTGFLSGLSTDLFGQALVSALTASGVVADFAIRSDRPTTLAFVTLRDGQASYAFYDENTAGRMLTPDMLPRLPGDIRAMFFGGISLAVEPCAQAYETLLLREAPHRLTMMDPNIRPGFIADEPAYRARIGRMIAASDIVKLSDEDLRWLAGPGDIEILATGILTAGPRLVFITEGAQGAHAFTSHDRVFCPAQRVQVVDTVGAGDTFNAGVLAALARAGALSKAGVAAADSALIESCLRLGIAAASVTVSRAGANPPWAAELEDPL
ncbi:MAG TPA: carbohydrate kinase [Paenirhodobacter sp.]